MGSKLLLNLPDKDLERIENLVKAGEYATKSEFIRFAVKQQLYSEDRVGRLEAATSKLQKQTRSRKQVEKETEDAKAETGRILSRRP
ncbi:MAG: ribbon-helix-helix domain-containing protein [Nitrososphaerales archaeon]